MPAPDTSTAEGRSHLAASALRGYAEGMRRRSRLRSYAGPENAEGRANLRAWAAAADELADKLRAGEMVVDHTFEGGA